MGDRANCIIDQKWSDDNETPAVWLYTHWTGHDLPRTVQKALARRVRWDDPSYLARIVFDQMTAGQHGEETGFGITTEMTDNDGYPLLVLYPRKGIVRFEDRNTREPLNEWSFESFLMVEFDGWEVKT